MKKSIIVMMVAVLLVSALFVSCKQEIATPQDSLGTVRISLPSSRDLTPDTPTSIIPAVNHWYYVATKVSGYYKTGEEDWGDLAAMASGQQVGDTFSAGGWSFSFYGYASAKSSAPENPKADAIYYAENIGLTVAANEENYIDVTLQGGDGIGFGKLTIHDIPIPTGLTLKLKIGAEEETITLPHEISLAAEGEQAYELRLYFGNELVGSASTSITVSKGYDYGITGTIESLDAQGTVVIKTVVYPQAVASDTQDVEEGEPTTFTTAVAPNGNSTTVTFPAGVLTGETYTLTTAVSGYEDVGSFVVESGNPVASIDLSLDGESSSEFSGSVTVTTYIAKGLTNPQVYYNGDGDNPTDVEYDSETGVLTFKTNHFSQFVVTSSDAIIVSDGTAYETLGDFAAAVNAGNSFAGKTVTLMKDVTLTGAWTPIGDGHRYQSNQNVFSGTFDGKGHTISGLNSNGFDPEISVVDDNEYTYGLFGYVKNGTVRNVILEDVSISQAANYQLENAGGVVGYLDGGKVENCAVSGSVSGYNGIGGVVGRAYGTCTIQNCTNSADVYGKKNVAGIVGFVNPLHNGTIKVLTNTNDGEVERTAVSGKEGAGAAAGIACYGCSDKVPGASGSVYITGNTNIGDIEDVGGDREGAIHYLTSHDKNTTTGTVSVQ